MILLCDRVLSEFSRDLQHTAGLAVAEGQSNVGDDIPHGSGRYPEVWVLTSLPAKPAYVLAHLLNDPFG